MSERNNIIKLWKEKNLGEARFIFTCGGDSMGDTEWEFSDANGNDCEAPKEIKDYLDNRVYNDVDFYVNSDGHYCGEAGTVTVTLDEDSEDEEEWDFSFSKSATSEWSESHTSKVEYALDDVEAAFVKEHILNINGGEDAGIAINFKHDFLMSDEEEAIFADLENKINHFVRDYDPHDNGEEVEGELQEWYTFTTNTDGDGDIAFNLTVEGNNLILYITNSMTVYKDDE
jgi:hypothetical protein